MENNGILIELKPGIAASRVRDYISNYRGIKATSMIDDSSVVIYYNSLEIELKRIIKSVSKLDAKGNRRKRHNNIKSIKEIQPDNKAA